MPWSNDGREKLYHFQKSLIIPAENIMKSAAKHEYNVKLCYYKNGKCKG